MKTTAASPGKTASSAYIANPADSSAKCFWPIASWVHTRISRHRAAAPPGAAASSHGCCFSHGTDDMGALLARQPTDPARPSPFLPPLLRVRDRRLLRHHVGPAADGTRARAAPSCRHYDPQTQIRAVSVV